MRYLAIAAGLAFAVSTVPVLGPAWAQPVGNPGAPAGGGGSGGGLAGVPEHQMNSFGKCWTNSDKANYRWGDCPAPKAQKAAQKTAHKGGHKKG